MSSTLSGSPLVGFEQAFDGWLAHRRHQGLIRQPSSERVYRSIWDAFTQWCVGQALSMEALSAADMEAFVLSRAGEPDGLTDRHAWRLLTLVDAVMRHAGSRQRGTGARHGPNRAADELLQARPAWRYANASDLDPLPEFLTAPQARQLVTWLLDDQSGYTTSGAQAGSWQALRNRTAVALQLGAGLTPGDVRAAQCAGVRQVGSRAGTTPARLRVASHGAVAEREVPIAVWAARLLQRWLVERTTAGLPGDVLFPGTRKGQPWAKVAQYNAANSVLTAAGVASASGGSFVLRHTFALRQLRRGHAPEDVARWLGVSDPGVMARYQRVSYDAEDLA